MNRWLHGYSSVCRATGESSGILERQTGANEDSGGDHPKVNPVTQRRKKGQSSSEATQKPSNAASCALPEWLRPRHDAIQVTEEDQIEAAAFYQTLDKRADRPAPNTTFPPHLHLLLRVNEADDARGENMGGQLVNATTMAKAGSSKFSDNTTDRDVAESTDLELIQFASQIGITISKKQLDGPLLQQ